MIGIVKDIMIGCSDLDILQFKVLDYFLGGCSGGAGGDEWARSAACCWRSTGRDRSEEVDGASVPGYVSQDRQN